jgi:hypothetical protein
VTDRAKLVISGAFCVGALVGCGGSSGAAVDAGVPVAATTRQEIVAMPEGYGGVATACHLGHRIYVSEVVGGYSGPPLAVIPNDPSCAEPLR